MKILKVFKSALQKLFGRIFTSNGFVKYEVKIRYLSEVDIDEGEIVKMQNEGWQICGSIGVPQNRTWCAEKNIKVPFRRPIK